MTFEELPKFEVLRIEGVDTAASVSGRFKGVIQTKENWIACLYIGSGQFLWGRFTAVNEETGARAELVYDESRLWVRTEFHPRNSIREGQVIPGGWEHEHCSICWEKISEYAQPFG